MADLFVALLFAGCGILVVRWRGEKPEPPH